MSARPETGKSRSNTSNILPELLATTSKDLLPSLWVPVLFSTYSFPLLFEYQFTMHQESKTEGDMGVYGIAVLGFFHAVFR